MSFSPPFYGKYYGMSNQPKIEFIDRELMDKVAESAAESPRRRMNYNFHRSTDEAVNRLLNVMHRGSYLPVHRHLNPDKSESIVVVRGKVGITIYDDAGMEVESRMVGAGCAITFVGGGSTGGVDVISFIICKIFKRAKSSVVFFLIDSTIILGGMFVIGSFVLTLLGILSAFVSALMIEKVFIGSSKSFIAQIITDKYEIINRDIIEKVDRGSTVIDIIGGYSGQPKKMIMVSFTVNQYAEIMNTIHKHDKTAFVTIHQAHEIRGEGWTR